MRPLGAVINQTQLLEVFILKSNPPLAAVIKTKRTLVGSDPNPTHPAWCTAVVAGMVVRGRWGDDGGGGGFGVMMMMMVVGCRGTAASREGEGWCE
ncbi:hypothetical protein Tco_0695771 [Tanacetum coccineum]